MNNFLENCLIIAVLLLIILIPVGLTVNSSRKRKNKKINFELQSAERNLQVFFEYTDQLDSFVIAMDRGKKMLIKMDLQDYQLERFDMNEISSCVLEEKRHGDTMQLLQLILCDKSQKRHPIIFYKQHHDNDWHLKRSISTAAQWKLLINDAIRQAA
jgi:glycine cleavage system pyridoxal-binding protein P